MKICDICGKLRNRNNIVKIPVNGISWMVCNSCSKEHYGWYCYDPYTGKYNVSAIAYMSEYISKEIGG